MKKDERCMANAGQKKNLSFKVSSDLTPEELSEFFKSISGIYQVFLCADYAEKQSAEFQKLLDGSSTLKLTTSEVFQNIDNYIEEEQRLEISSIKMASPGYIDFSGIPGIIIACGIFMRRVLPDVCATVNKKINNLFLALLKKQTNNNEEQKLQKTIKRLLKEADKEKEALKALEMYVNSIQRLKTKKKIQGVTIDE